MAKIPLVDVGTLGNPSSARQNMNENFERIQQAFEDVLDRLGREPNQMEAEIDMNSHKILNVADPVEDSDAVNKRSVKMLVDQYTSQIVELVVLGSAVVDGPFTATASQTEFALSFTPGAIQNVSAFIDGVAQAPTTDFTLSGPTLQTLTFLAPLTAGSLVLIRYFRALPSGQTQAESVTYTDPNTGFAGTVKNYLDGLASSAGSALVRFLHLGSTATPRTVQAKLRDFITPFDYGAVGDGVADDRQALVDADNAAFSQGKVLRIPNGTFRVTSSIATLKASWVGEAGSKIVAANTLVLNGPSMLEWQAGSNQLIQGLTVDFQSRPCTIGSEAVIGVAASDGFVIDSCKVLNMTGSGIAANGARNFKITNNVIKRATASNAFNQAILVSSSARQSNNGTISNNVCEKSAINISVTNCTVENNDIYDWGFGGGITTEQDVANSNNCIIKGNRVHGGVGIDTNFTRPMGIENWAPGSVITGNVCYANSGSGIDQGGQNTRCSDNICYNNGQSASTSGISARYGTGTFNASGSSFTGNTCFDTQGVHTQTTGYSEQSTSLVNISVRNNQFNTGTGVTPELVQSVLSDYSGPAFSFQLAWDAGNIAAGANGTNSFTCPGASLGDLVTASFSNSLQGLQLTGYVSASNTVTLLLTNNTGIGIDLPAGTYRVKVEKYVNYPPY